MEVVNFSEFRANLKKSLDEVYQDSEVLIVSRPRNENVVVLSLREYNSMLETMHLMSTEANRKRLDDAIQRDKEGHYEIHRLIEE
jgi:antitoxin YefM